MKSFVASTLLLAIALVSDAQESKTVLVGQSELATVWANIQITRMRVDQPYLPMVIGLQNLAAETAKITRESIRLVGPDGRRYPVAGLKEVRKNYPMLNQDRRVVNAAGIPWEVWYRQRRLRESNFFPGVMGRSGTVIDHVTLRRQDGMVDLFYFPRPHGFAAGTPVILEISAEGWEGPIRLGIRLE
jgi:hypothetical protein